MTVGCFVLPNGVKRLAEKPKTSALQIPAAACMAVDGNGILALRTSRRGAEYAIYNIRKKNFKKRQKNLPKPSARA